MNFADNFKKNAYKGSDRKKKKPFDSSENGGRVNINVRLKENELDEKINLTKKEICQSALFTLSSIYFVYRDAGHPLDFGLRNFIDKTVSIVLEDLFRLDKAGGPEKILDAGAGAGGEDFLEFFKAFQKTSGMEPINFAADDGDEDET